MISQWTADLISKMHIYKINQSELSQQLGCTREHVNAVLNGRKEPKNAEERFTAALDEIIIERESLNEERLKNAN